VVPAVVGVVLTVAAATTVSGDALRQDPRPDAVDSVPASLNLYVSKTACSDQNPGTASSKPLCTIMAAAAKARSGTTVRVAAGTYSETVSVGKSGTADRPIVFQGAPGATITAGGNGFRLSRARYVSVEGFTITRTVRAGILVQASDHVLIEGNDISYAGQPVDGGAARGISLTGTTASTVRGNRTHDNTDDGIGLTDSSNENVVDDNESYGNARQYIQAAAGIRISESAGNTVTANRLHDNEDSGLDVWLRSAASLAVNNVIWGNTDHGIDVHASDDCRVVANTVYRNGDSGIELTGSRNGALANNISVDNGINSSASSGQIRADAFSAESATADHDLLWLSVPGGNGTYFVEWADRMYTSAGLFQASTGLEPHLVAADPQFVDPAHADLHLAPGSPAVGKANSQAPGEPSVDADGRDRTTLFDVGAYESS